MLSRILDYVIQLGDPDFLANVLELSACITAELGEGPYRRCAPGRRGGDH